MADDSRVAVYLDFDNIVISRYDQAHGEGSWRKDDARHHRKGDGDAVGGKLDVAVVDVGAIVDFASSFGTVALVRAYADWSLPANAAYRQQLVDRAIDLVQLFSTAGTKNGADIRLSVDAVDDLYQHDDITHVVVVAGDSDYIPLAQRCKRLGRYVVGVGVSGATSTALVSACNEFSDYDALPDVAPLPVKAKATKAPAKKATSRGGTDPQAEATRLLVRAMRQGTAKSDDEWLFSGGVKSQMQRLDPSFKEKSLGFSSFRAFVESRADEVETQQNGQQLQLRLKG